MAEVGGDIVRVTRRRLAEGLAEERLTHSIIGAFYEVHKALGFGFLEHVYILALERELLARKHRVAREVSVGVMYKDEELCMQRIDMIVDDKVIVETKSTFHLHPSADRQLYSYLRSTNLEVGLLLHFGREAKFYRSYSRNPARVASARPRDLEDEERTSIERTGRRPLPDAAV